MSETNSPGEMAAVEDVSEMELTELERIRESLRMQLCGENDDTTDSESSCIEKPSESADLSLDVGENQQPSAATTELECLVLETSLENERESSNPANVSISNPQSETCPGESLLLNAPLESKCESLDPEIVSLSTSQLDRCLGEGLLLKTSSESKLESSNPESVSQSEIWRVAEQTAINSEDFSLSTSQLDRCLGESLLLETFSESKLESSNPESISQSESCPFAEQAAINPKSPIPDDHHLPHSKADSNKISESEENCELSLENNILSDAEKTSFTVAEDKVSDSNKISECEEKRELLLENEILSDAEPTNLTVDKVSIGCASTKPPLVMHSSNLLLNEGLDNSHGGGGFETTGQEGSPPGKRRKLDSSPEADSEMALVNEDSQQAAGCEDSSMVDEMAEDYENGNELDDMEFDILDEYESDGKEEPQDNDARSSSDSSLDEMDHDQIEALLDEKLKNSKSLDPNNPLAHQEKQKVVLKVRGRDHFEVLPEGWVEVTHNCGMPVYLHKQTRVCSMSKPYFLGPGSTRKHKIPVSAIPCLHYQKETEKEKQRTEAALQNVANGLEDASSTPIATSGCPVDAASKENGVTVPVAANGIFPSANLQSAKDTKESGSLDFLALRRYCEKRFEFQRITVKRFSTWTGRRNHQRKMRLEQRPFLADNTQLISCRPVLLSDNSTAAGSNASKKEFIMNPSGKSPVCILHEYVQHALRKQPSYEFRELENAGTPYGAAVVIDGIKYGNGLGSSKKLAKSAAAEAALRILIPNMKLHSKEESSKAQDQDVEFFDQVRVEDPRVSDLSVKAGQPFPYQILLECLKRNHGMGDTQVEISMKNLKHQKNEFHMKVGNHEVSVVCKNKRDGKHRASQAILQKLHPHISSWGSLLRMYGKGSFKTLKEKKEEEQRITELQSKACANKPNTSILGKLKEEMLKYREKVMSKKPIGKLIPERMEIITTSSSNLKSLEL
ncbi:hypothetical protein JTE90_016307 [Oedothorax gibbosus]|uniref:DRBM domain-containing protein n=1 Tax=Oedothorax gibbosus TaxID=931172 RepID=A0AAV6U941_9ARAC|nr:hypothetical protein JTE90_016307 [Oedothorax gibbosus]